MSDIEREEFEQAVADKWSDSYKFTRFGDEDYYDEVLEGMWWGWQAGRQGVEGEPVAVVDRVGIMQRLSPYTNLPEGTKLYTHPASAATLQFGNGNLVVVDGSFDDVPAVFISPAIELGNAPDTALSGKDAERRTDMLYGDETVLLFKTAEHASVVAGALIRGNYASNYRHPLVIGKPHRLAKPSAYWRRIRKVEFVRLRILGGVLGLARM